MVFEFCIVIKMIIADPIAFIAERKIDVTETLLFNRVGQDNSIRRKSVIMNYSPVKAKIAAECGIVKKIFSIYLCCIIAESSIIPTQCRFSGKMIQMNTYLPRLRSKRIVK